MKPTKIFMASAFITAVILIVIGAVTSTVMANQAASQAVVETVPSLEELQAYQEREAAYKQLIEQANQQLEQANVELQAMQQQINQLQPQITADQPPAAQEISISTQQAREIAGKTAEIGLKPLKDPELVSFEGKAAFEIVYELGSIYIDAQTGEVLFNGTVPQIVTPEQAAQIASDYLQNKAILQVDEIPFRGAQIYRVIFKDGTLAFLELTGQITYIQAPGPRVDASQVSFDSGGGGGSDHYEDDDSSGEHEDDDEHEDEHDD